MKIKYLSLILSILGILLLYFLSTLSQPIQIELFEISKYDGQEIVTAGVVTEYQTTSYDNQIITIRSNNTTAEIFSETPTTLRYGDYIQVTGTVQQYQDTWEIMVDGPELITLISSWENMSTPLWDLANNPTGYVDMNINVSGYIDSIYDSYFYLSDDNNTYNLLVTSSSFFNLSIIPGKPCYIHAFFTYDPSHTCYMLRLQGPEHTIKYITDR
jgi:hypothetical protein